MIGYICVQYGFDITDEDMEKFKRIVRKRGIDRIISIKLNNEILNRSIELYYHVIDSIKVSSDFDFIRKEILKEYDYNENMFKVSFSFRNE